ncbi:hypothetical protein [Chryseobacterium salviniae]|uniref:Uncharacterized protein n=1 Tax=Chryseobacterium salviniae TaxID=3101750 RepID=A0ABU6HS02_9FLAO|nr:hypothetical protein [Chryseobacterium sp. T9W2-O]MEC3875840.1 hypothetical protein [Chryseobacterium sp. T9W2-O]
MKNLFTIFLILIAGTADLYSQPIPPNTNRFSVINYIALDGNGKYIPYTVHGFYESVPKGSMGRVYILPILKFDVNNIKYIDSKGRETYKNSDDIRTLVIPITQELALPNESQKASIGAAIKSTTVPAYYPPVVKNMNGQPLLNPLLNSNPSLSNHFISLANQYEATVIAPQQQLINDFNTSFQSQIVSPNEVEFTVEAGGQIIYNQSIPGTYIVNGTFRNIKIENPTEYTKNVLSEGNGDISVSYKFKNSKVSYINAHIDASAVVNHVLSEAYKSSVSQRSSGWAFLGFGSSKKSMKSSFNEQVNSQYDKETINGTRIEMYDADEDMINSFEKVFFPDISEEEAIKNHLAAAEKAKAEGNEKLQNFHLQYAEALTKNDPNLTPDIEAAVAALGKKDYVGFVANGVRWGNNKGVGKTSIQRVLNSTEMTKLVKDYSSVKTISVQHAVTQPVMAKEVPKYKPSMGMIDPIPWEGQLYMFNGYNAPLQNIRCIFAGPITQGGALHRNNILPGTLIKSVGSHPVYDIQSFSDALKNYEPYERIYLTLIVPTMGYPNVYQEKHVEFTLGALPDIDQ